MLMRRGVLAPFSTEGQVQSGVNAVQKPGMLCAGLPFSLGTANYGKNLFT